MINTCRFIFSPFSGRASPWWLKPYRIISDIAWGTQFLSFKGRSRSKRLGPEESSWEMFVDRIWGKQSIPKEQRDERKLSHWKVRKRNFGNSSKGRTCSSPSWDSDLLKGQPGYNSSLLPQSLTQSLGIVDIQWMFTEWILASVSWMLTICQAGLSALYTLTCLYFYDIPKAQILSLLPFWKEETGTKSLSNWFKALWVVSGPAQIWSYRV